MQVNTSRTTRLQSSGEVLVLALDGAFTTAFTASGKAARDAIFLSRCDESYLPLPIMTSRGFVLMRSNTEIVQGSSAWSPGVLCISVICFAYCSQRRVNVALL
jgi:hypothetical protein